MSVAAWRWAEATCAAGAQAPCGWCLGRRAVPEPCAARLCCPAVNGRWLWRMEWPYVRLPRHQPRHLSEVAAKMRSDQLATPCVVSVPLDAWNHAVRQIGGGRCQPATPCAHSPGPCPRGRRPRAVERPRAEVGIPPGAHGPPHAGSGSRCRPASGTAAARPERQGGGRDGSERVRQYGPVPARQSPSSASFVPSPPVALPSAQPVPAGRESSARAAAMTTSRSTPDRIRRTSSSRSPGRASSVQQALPVPLRTLGQPGRGKYVPVTASCGGCDLRWTDEDAAHCRGCHGHWADVAGFDDHLPECPSYVPIAPATRSRARKAS